MPRIYGKLSKETREKMSAASIGRRKTLKHRKNMSLGMRGKPKSPAHRVALSLAVKAAWERRRREND